MMPLLTSPQHTAKPVTFCTAQELADPAIPRGLSDRGVAGERACADGEPVGDGIVGVHEIAGDVAAPAPRFPIGGDAAYVLVSTAQVLPLVPERIGRASGEVTPTVEVGVEADAARVSHPSDQDLPGVCQG